MKLKRRHSVAGLLIVAFALGLLLIQPWSVAQATQDATTFTITFQNWDGEVISSETYEPGAEVVIPADPAKEADETYTYTFAGWDAEVSATAQADATYTAQFEQTYIEYTVTFKTWDGEVISSEVYHYGDEVVVPDTPEREGYVFAGWGEEFSELCKGSVEYTAQYTEPEVKKNTAALTGPTTVRAGNTIKLTFSVDGTEITEIRGALSFDESQLTLTNTTVLIEGNWVVEFDGNNFWAYAEAGENPINSKTELFTVSFEVGELEPDTELIVSVVDIKVSAGEEAETEEIETASYTVNITPPKSEINTLSSLTVSNGTLSPAFKPDIATYTMSVPFSVTKLTLKYEKTDSKSTIRVSNPELVAGETTKVTIKVTAENGKSKTYTISVKRDKDPSYTPSGNNNLSGIRVGGFLLSPVFTPERTQYVIWLPYETDRVTVMGLTQDSTATVRTEGGENLAAGADNEIKVICTAENGEEKVYTVIAKRAAAHNDQPSRPTRPTEPTDPTQPDQPTRPTLPADHVCPEGDDFPLIMIIIPWIVAIVAVAALLVMLLSDMKKEKEN